MPLEERKSLEEHMASARVLVQRARASQDASLSGELKDMYKRMSKVRRAFACLSVGVLYCYGGDLI